MQALLYKPPCVHGVGELEWPPCKTPIPPSLHHEEDHNDLVVLHMDPKQCHVQQDATLSKENDRSDSPMSFKTDAAPR